MVLVLRKTYFLKVVAKFDKDHFSFYDFFCQSPHCAAVCYFALEDHFSGSEINYPENKRPEIN